jgi:hypothetical protein
MRVIPIVRHALAFLLLKNGKHEPKSSRLVGCAKLVEERAIWRDRTLSDERGAICPVRLLLLDAMPVL